MSKIDQTFTLKKTGTDRIRISRAIDLCQKIYLLGQWWKFAMKGNLSHIFLAF